MILQFMSGYVRFGQVRYGSVSLIHVRSGYASLGQDSSG
jgi:hypothetical protein